MHTLVNTQAASPGKKSITISYKEKFATGHPSHIITGSRQKIIRWLIWCQIFLLALRHCINPMTARKKVRELKALRNSLRNQHTLSKYVRAGNRYYFSFNAPGWPSRAFNRYAEHMLGRIGLNPGNSLFTLLFAITKKCGFQCEHCFEWFNLNKPDTLSRENLLQIVQRFHQLGVSQVQLSGGEPLNRFRDIIYLLEHAPRGIDFWLYTTGYSLTAEKAFLLKKHGLTGITISLDHHEEEKHNAFRGVKDAFARAMTSLHYAKEAGFVTCFSLCATKEFITETNLTRYMELARLSGVSFIQVLEPRATGHYAGKDVAISAEQKALLETFFETYNYNPAYSGYPTISYPGYTSRRLGCSGSGLDYVYADTDGDIHNCPFCQKKLFSSFDENLPERIRQMKTAGCNAFPSCSADN